MAVLLTDRLVRSLKATGRVYRVRDAASDLRGFHVVVSAKGAKTYALAFTSPVTSARRFLALGSVQALSLADARTAARLAREEIRQGRDPIEERKRRAGVEALLVAQAREQEQAAARRGTLGDLCALYVAELRRRKARSAETVERYHFAREVLPYLGDRQASEVTSEDIAGVLARIVARGRLTYSNRVRGSLSAAFRFARRARLSPHWRTSPLLKDFALTHNPVEDIPPEPEVPGSRTLTAEEARALYRDFDQGDVFTQTAMRLLLATGQRVEEVLQSRWADFDLIDPERAVWIIPAARRKTRGKVSVDHVVPLLPVHLELLARLSRLHGCPYLFPSIQDLAAPRSSQAFASTVRRYVTAHELAPFAPRDLRRTFKTLGGALGLTLEIRNRLQGHAFADIGSRHYDRHGYLDEKREAMRVWVAWLTGDGRS